MAFTKGDLITASALNSVNATAGRFSETNPSGADWIQGSIGNDGIVCSHASSGSRLFQVRMDCGWFGGGNLTVRKWVDNGWNETVYDHTYGWNTHTDINVNSTGPGRYRIYSGTAWQVDAAGWQVYFGQTDCVAGGFLVRWDDKFSSPNRIQGDQLTAGLLNTGYIGTTPTL